MVKGQRSAVTTLGFHVERRKLEATKDPETSGSAWRPLTDFQFDLPPENPPEGADSTAEERPGEEGEEVVPESDDGAPGPTQRDAQSPMSGEFCLL